MATTVKTTAVFVRPFELASFDEVLPAGEYELETVYLGPVDGIEPGRWTSSVLVHLRPRASHPGLQRTLKIPLAELETAMAKDKLTGKSIVEFFLEEMLADPMIRLVMQADGVSDAEIRDLYPDQTATTSGHQQAGSARVNSKDNGRAGLNENRQTFSRQRFGERDNDPTAVPCGSPEWIGIPASRKVTSTDDPVDLDLHRSPESKMEIEERRHVVLNLTSAEAARRKDNAELGAQMLAMPARTWPEAMEKAQFLLRRYSATPEAHDARIQKLIRRALSDMARLGRRGDSGA